MMLRPALWPLLWRRQAWVYVLMLALPSVMILGIAGSAEELADLREMTRDPEGRAIARQLAMLVVPYLTVIGALVGHAVFEVHRMQASWLLPGMRRQVQGQWLLLALGLAGLWTVWVGSWAPHADALSAGCMGVVAFGLGASLHHLGVHVPLARTGSLLLLALAAATLYGTSWLVALTDVLGLPGMIVAAALSACGLWWFTTAPAHRRLMAWAPDATAAADTTANATPLSPPQRPVAWLARLLSERSSWTKHSTIPSFGATAANATLIAVVLHATHGPATMLGLAALHDSLTLIGRPLAYPISRRDRGTLQWAMQALEVVVLGVVAGGILFGLDRLGVPVLSAFEARERGTVPSVVLGASVLALMPLGQAGRVWLPAGGLAVSAPTTRLWCLLPVLPSIFLATETARLVWRISAPGVGVAVAWCAALGLVMQALNFAYCRWVMGRRDLVAGLRT